MATEEHMTRARASGGRRVRRAPVGEVASDGPSLGEPGPATGNGAGAPDGPSEDAIRVRAYEIYLRRGDGPGNALEDWLAAQRALRTAVPGELS